MDSHIETADPWAAKTDVPEPEAQEHHEAGTAASDGTFGHESTSAESGGQSDSKVGLFGRRKLRERLTPSEDGGFDLIAPAPHLLGEDPHFEVIESDTLTEVPELGLGDSVGPTEEVPFEPSLSMVEPLSDTVTEEEKGFDFETMSEEIAKAVADAQPTGIFGALANPGAQMSTPEAESPASIDDELAEQSLSPVAENDDLLIDTENVVDDDHESEEPPSSNEDDIEMSSLLSDNVEPDADKPPTDKHETDEEPKVEADEIADEPETEVGDEVVINNGPTDIEEQAEIPADPFDDTPTEMPQDSQEANEIVEEPDKGEPSMDQTTTTYESEFSLTNALAEPIAGEEGLFVSEGTEEAVKEVVLVTTSTVPGMEMGESCGLVTAVQAADEAASLPRAIEKAHTDLGAKAEEVGATAVISVTTNINEVAAGFLVIASGTAVVAAN